MSVTGIVTAAPAATACAKLASTSGTYKCSVTGEPFSVFGPKAFHSGASSNSISVESPMRSAAFMILPSGPSRRFSSIAPNAFL